MSDKYNGWTNRETWLVNLWYEPETQSDLDFAKEDLEEKVEALGNGPLADMICLSEINWRELSGTCIEREDWEGDDGSEVKS